MKKWLPWMLSGAVVILAAQIIAPFTVGIRFTFFFATLCGIALMIYGLLELLYKRGIWKKGMLFLKRLVLVGACLFLLSFVVVELLIVKNGQPEDTTGRSTLVVLGAGVHGETPSLTLVSRLEVAEQFLKENPEAVAILCGGQGPGEAITEALAMERYLTKNGIAKERLYREEESSDTAQNLQNAAALVEEHQLDDEMVLLTNHFHMWRSKLLAQRYGLDCVALPATMPNVFFLKENYYLREYFSLLIFSLEGMGITLDTSAIGM